MCDLIFEYGMPTVSWYAELAFRRRVSMSAIGSVIPMALWPSPPRFPHRTYGVLISCLPAGFGDAGELAAMCHRAEADPAQAEPAVDRTRPSALRAPRVTADLELGRALLLHDQRLLRHFLSPP